MSAKDSITIQTCELSKDEFNDFLTLYPIPSEYRVILPRFNQTVFDAPPGYVGLYIYSFSLANIRLPLTEFFCEPSVDLFRGFFNLCRAGKWLTFAKRFEKHIPNLLPKVITHIEGWHERFFYVQDSIIPAKYPQLMFEQNKLDSKSFKDKLPPNIEENPMNFIYTEDDEDLSFLPKEPSSGFGTGSPFVSINTEPLKANEEPVIQPAKVTVDSGSSRPPVKRKIIPGSSTSRATRAKTSSSKDDAPFLTVSDDDEGLPDVLELKDATDFHLKISAITPLAWKNHLDNHMDVELLDLYDRCYARQAVVDNAVNRRETAREEECEGLRVKCEAAMTEFEKNPAVVALWEKISVLSIEVKENKLNLDRMMLETQKWTGYQQNLLTLESKVTFLEAEKARLEAVEVSLHKEVEELKQDRRDVVSKVIPYATMKLIHSDDMGSLIGRHVSSIILYGRCRAYNQVANMKEHFDLSKVKGYRSSYKKDHTQASYDLATTTFPWLDEFVVDPFAPIEVLLS
ncbi:hypothetical protein Tco_1217825 [Tanacetum coccineum]